MDYKKAYEEALEKAAAYCAKYEKALEKAKAVINVSANQGETQAAIETIFPELAESEDEIHRKWILEYLYVGLREADEQFKDQFKSAIGWLEKQKEQKPAEWSEDIIQKAIKEVGLTQHQIDWFKTNVFPPKQEWSEEDEKMRQSILNLISITFSKTYRKEINWLKSLPLDLKKKNEDVAKLCSNEWSEEDEKVIADSHEQLIRFANSWERGGNPDNADAVRKIACKLKSLPPRPHWKPSKEQKDGLFHACNRMTGDYYHNALVSLYEDLKKLM